MHTGGGARSGNALAPAALLSHVTTCNLPGGRGGGVRVGLAEECAMSAIVSPSYIYAFSDAASC